MIGRTVLSRRVLALPQLVNKREAAPIAPARPMPQRRLRTRTLLAGKLKYGTCRLERPPVRAPNPISAMSTAEWESAKAKDPDDSPTRWKTDR